MPSKIGNPHSNKLIINEHKGARPGSRGTKNDMAIGKAIVTDSKKMKNTSFNGVH